MVSASSEHRSPLEPLVARLAAPVVELCLQLERIGIAAWIQGEALLDAWLGTTAARPPTAAIVCAAAAPRLRDALPKAVVTAPGDRRLTQTTAAGPVDLLPVPAGSIDEALADFGLAPLALALRPASGEWAGDAQRRERLAKHELALVPGRKNPFDATPRRFWLAARLLAEYALEPTPELIAAAADASSRLADPLPDGAFARRALERILACPHPSRALAFLRESGIAGLLVPDLDPALESRLDRLARLPALRFAALLRGPVSSRALARLRMPAALARRISRLQEAHPLDRTLDGLRDPQVRRAMNRFSADELDGLVAWRQLEVARGSDDVARARLAQIERAIARLRAQADASHTLRALALDGADVMRLLGAGPGPHVGRALAHLALFVAEDPARNERAALEAELHAWAGRPTTPGG